MKKKKYLALLCAAVLACGAFFCGCASATTETEANTAQTTETEAPKPMMMGEITAIDGTTVTLQLRGGRGGIGEKGEAPEKPTDDEKPELKEDKERPEGENPVDGKRPESMPEAETITVDLSAFDTVNAEELAVGDMLSVEMDADGNVTAVATVDLSQMPERPEGKPENTPAEEN